nr:carboxypeptidase-like regulatory domain-containing protein [uncultured Flavobacterium sp.]
MIVRIALFVFCFVTGSLFSQTLEGTVFDENKKPMLGVSVYLNGTTIGTATDDSGKYSLKVNGKLNTALVVRFIGYETVFVPNPFEDNNITVYLKPKEAVLDEVIVQKDPFTREDKLKIFREQFLGKTKAGKSCRILNEEDIEFEYDFKANKLIARSEKSIKVENPHLSYLVEFELHDFYIKFYKKSIKSSDVLSSLFLGTSLYSDLKPSDKTAKFRNEAYQGSQMHFFKNLSNNVWGKKDFLLFNGSYQDIPDHFFSIAQEGNLKKVIVSKNTISTGYIANTDGTKFISTFNLLFNKKKQSKVDFLTKEFYVDQFGNITDADKIQFGGDIGTKRLGDMLPMDFIPKI